jgi:hypothetical protein
MIHLGERWSARVKPEVSPQSPHGPLVHVLEQFHRVHMFMNEFLHSQFHVIHLILSEAMSGRMRLDFYLGTETESSFRNVVLKKQ